MSDYSHIPGIQIKTLNQHDCYLTPRLCPHINVEGGCELHNKRTQPRVCKYFPMHHEDGTYITLKHVCTYKFKEVKNNKHKKETKQ